jgi:hypothetical protein
MPAISLSELTAFFSFFVRGFPDFVSSGGGIGGAGTDKADDSCSSFSTSVSRIEEPPGLPESPNVK